MKSNSTKRKYIRAISFLSFFCVLLVAVAVVNSYQARKYRLLSTTSSQRAISELCENLDNITINLQKGVYTNSEAMLSHIGTELSKEAACAKVSLSQLTSEDMVTDGIYKFLSQVGDFTLAVDKKLQNGSTLSENDREALSSLYAYSLSLSNGLGTIRDGYYDGTVSFEKVASTLSLNSGEPASFFTDSVNDAEQSLADYPTLLYDGPFADSILNKEARAVKGKDEVSLEAATAKAADLLGCNQNELLRESDEESSLELYCFSKGSKTVGITKRGGLLCYLTNPDFADKSEIGEETAIKIAKEYLLPHGYKNMKESYYSTYDGVCTINFAYYDKGVTFYPDLIKVSVALDKSTVVAVDARGYLMNHHERSLPKISYSLKKAERNISPSLALLNSQTALIPLKDGTEKLCHELHCRDNGNQEVLIYVDAETGAEDDIQLLLYSDSGILAR